MPGKLKLALPILLAIIVTKPALAGTTPPTTTYSITPSSPNGNNDWYTQPVVITLDATDLESGAKEINYQIDTNPWQKVEFVNSLNLAPNPSFETAGSTDTGMESWAANSVDGQAIFSQDIATFLAGYATSSARIEAFSGNWHGINHQNTFAVASPFENMTASVWLKTQNVAGAAGFKVYAIGSDSSVELIAESANLTGTTAWTQLNTNLVVTKANAVGVFMEIGLSGPGTIWADAASITSSIQDTSTQFTVGADGQHTVSFYSVDNAGNVEGTQSRNFKIDQTPPGNWHDSGAARDIIRLLLGITVLGNSHELFVYATVEDETSGLSTFTDKYQYQIPEQHPGEFGSYSNLLSCSSTWQPNAWETLYDIWFIPGTKSAKLITQKTDFCNSNWKICKTVRFRAEDLAGNIATKDFCINGPWIKARGEGHVRANYNIDMLSEAENDNTDGLIETGGTFVGFFTSSENWIVKNAPAPQTLLYQDFWDMTGVKQQITDGNLVASSDIYYVEGDLVLTNQSVPNDYDNNTFTQIVFVNGNLTIERNIELVDTSAALFIVSGNVEISKNVGTLEMGIFADGDVFTAYDIEEQQSTGTLVLDGIYTANKFYFQRNLQGTNNDDSPSEDFRFEPKYIIQMKDYISTETVKWLGVE